MNKTTKMNKIKKYADFGQIWKINIQLDDYYENGENAKIQKNYDAYVSLLSADMVHNFHQVIIPV